MAARTRPASNHPTECSTNWAIVKSVGNPYQFQNGTFVMIDAKNAHKRYTRHSHDEARAELRDDHRSQERAHHVRAQFDRQPLAKRRIAAGGINHHEAVRPFAHFIHVGLHLLG